MSNIGDLNERSAARGISTPGAIGGGALGGAAVGTVLAGPIGTLLGALAGALGGGWLVLAERAAENYTPADDARYRQHFETLAERPADVGFERVRPAYLAGHLAARHPEHQGKHWDEVEVELARGWDAAVAKEHGAWNTVRPYARAAFDELPPHGDPLRDAAGADVPSTGAEEPPRPSYTDPLPNRSHALDPSVPDEQESREQAPPSPDWLRPEREGP